MRDKYDFSKAERVDPEKFKDYKFEMAETDQTEDYWEQIDAILDALDHPEALVTDLSSFGDFMLDEDELKCLSEKFEMEIKEETLLINVAKFLRKGG